MLIGVFGRDSDVTREVNELRVNYGQDEVLRNSRREGARRQSVSLLCLFSVWNINGAGYVINYMSRNSC